MQRLPDLQLGLLSLLEQRDEIDKQLAEFNRRRVTTEEQIAMQRGAIWQATQMANSATGNNDLSVEDGEDGEPPEAAE